jgi:hypothetical protein
MLFLLWSMASSLVLCCSVLLGAQADDLFVNDPRPMAAMAEKIEQQTGWTITYEDPSYQFAGDIVEFPGEAAEGKSYFGMRPVPFVFTFDAETRKDAVRAVGALVDHFEMRTGGQKFRVLAEKGFIHLVPELNRDKDGMWAAQRPALDTRISLPAGKRSLMDFLVEVTAVLSQESGRRIDVGTVALNLMLNTQVELPAFKDTQARVVLREAFTRSGLKLSWQLLGGVGDENQALNVHPVGARRLPTLE